MDEYDYEESTTYSTTNVSVEETPEVKHNIFEDSQIHTLYQARVEEVVNLKQELQLLRARLDEERQINANREALAESELQKCKISMQQAQELLCKYQNWDYFKRGDRLSLGQNMILYCAILVNVS